MSTRRSPSVVTRDWLSISKALIVRFILTFHVILCTYRVVVDLKNRLYWLLLCGLFPLICETCYTIARRQGVEFSRFTPCFFFYLCAVLPGIWLLELDKTDLVIDGRAYLLSQVNSTANEELLSVISLSPMTWLIVIEEMLPYVMFMSRWILPRGRVRREELAELLFAFIEIAADIMEFFSMIGDDIIRSNKSLAYCVLSIWSLAILQFTMTVTVIHQPKKEKKVQIVVVESKKAQEWERNQQECYAIFLTIIMQDLPFAVMRLYTIINFNYINYSLIFFTSKNLIIILLLLYKVAALCKSRHCPDREDTGKDVERVTVETEFEGSVKCHCKNGNSFENVTNISIEKPCINDDGSYTQRNHWSPDVESGLKKRCQKPIVSHKNSPSNERDKPHGLYHRNSDSAPSTSNESLCDITEGSAMHSPELCKVLSLDTDQDDLPVETSAKQENCPAIHKETSNTSSLEAIDNRLGDLSIQTAVTAKDPRQFDTNIHCITRELKDVEGDVSVPHFLNPSNTLPYLLLSGSTSSDPLAITQMNVECTIPSKIHEKLPLEQT